MASDKEKSINESEIEPTDAISVSGSADTQATNVTASLEVKENSSTESVPAIHSYRIKPDLQDRFKPAMVKELIRNCLSEKLTGKSYDIDLVKKWTSDIANEINERVRDLKMKRYKHIVQVTIGEHKGAGVRSGVRCLWDSDTDGYTSEVFSNVRALLYTPDLLSVLGHNFLFGGGLCSVRLLE